MYQKLTAGLLVILLVPLFLLLFILVKYTSQGPFLFVQKRVGKNMKVFILYKIRTMVENAEALKKKYQKLNEADEPVFKIRNDPRYTHVGKFLSHTGLDEIPQLINVIRGEMALVGPRPLPASEALKVPKEYQKRFSVLPGITSPWILKGAHKLSFRQWMELDMDYIKKRSLGFDICVFLSTMLLILRLILRKI